LESSCCNKDKKFPNKEKEIAYFGAKRIEENLIYIDENRKIILLYNKWLRVQNDNSDN
jgi:hypothetical protein